MIDLRVVAPLLGIYSIDIVCPVGLLVIYNCIAVDVRRVYGIEQIRVKLVEGNEMSGLIDNHTLISTTTSGDWLETKLGKMILHPVLCYS